MMKKLFLTLAVVLLLISGCKKTEVVQLNLKGTVVGYVTLYDEFRNEKPDYSGATVTLDGSDPEISAITDADGRYELADIPSGTYDVVISKEGYAENRIQSIGIVGGGNEPIGISSCYLCEISKTTIDDLAVEIDSIISEINFYKMFLTGNINHNATITDTMPIHFAPLIRFFVSVDNNPSTTNYVFTSDFLTKTESGAQFREQIRLHKSLFEPGTTIYIIAYGSSNYDGDYYDYFENKYIYNDLGQPSNIASITLP